MRFKGPIDKEHKIKTADLNPTDLHICFAVCILLTLGRAGGQAHRSKVFNDIQKLDFLEIEKNLLSGTTRDGKQNLFENKVQLAVKTLRYAGYIKPYVRRGSPEHRPGLWVLSISSRKKFKYLRALSSPNTFLDAFNRMSEIVYQARLRESYESIERQKKASERADKASKKAEEVSKTAEATYRRIRSFFPGAVSIGIASIFEKQEKSYEKSTLGWLLSFVGTLILMAGFIFVLNFTNSISIVTIDKEENVSSIENYITKTVIIFTFLSPLVWFSVFSSKQYRQNKRLQQEYAHKKIMAQTYQGYKEEFEQTGDQRIIDELHKVIIESVAKNPSEVMDKGNANDHPYSSLLKKQ